jgi:hypothetical protein
MARHLKLFDTTAQYNAYTADTSNFITPNVSVAKDAPKTVYYHPYVDPYAGHDYVEIGGIKWATMNIGANDITDAGLYFQWGDASGYTASQVGSGSGQKAFNWEDYKYATNVSFMSATMTKYNSTDEKTVLDDDDDAAKAYWGGKWRMPTRSEFITFSYSVNTAWTTNYQDSGVAGVICTYKSDSSKVLFFPAGGGVGNSVITEKNEACCYWSKTRYNSEDNFAYLAYIMSDYRHWGVEQRRNAGNNIRAVAD